MTDMNSFANLWHDHFNRIMYFNTKVLCLFSQVGWTLISAWTSLTGNKRFEGNGVCFSLFTLWAAPH